jgi:O-antigen/teichoic acid export membrane protein
MATEVAEPGLAYPGAALEAPGRRVRRLRRPAVAGAGLVVVGSTLTWHLANFGFNAVAARVLGPGGYGTLAAAIALLYVASPLFVTIQTIASRAATKAVVSGTEAELRAELVAYGRRVAFAALLVAAVFALASGGLARFLRIGSPAPLAILGAGLGLALVTHLQRGVLQGTMRFGRYAASTVVEGVGKISFAAVLLLVWRSVDAAMAAVVLGTAGGFVANTLLLRFLPRGRRRPSAGLVSVGYSAATLGTLVLLAALLSLDVLAAKRYLPASQAGLYASISLCGKVVFFATSAIAVYLFPIFSQRHDAGQEARGPLVRALTLIAAASGGLAAIYFVAPGLVLTPLFGDRFEAGARYLGWIGLGFGAYGVAYLTAMYLLAHRRPACAWILGSMTVAQLAGLYALHRSIGLIVAVDAAVFVTGAVALAWAALRQPAARAPASSAP